MKTVAVVVTLGALAAGGIAGSAGAQQPPGRTIVLTELAKGGQFNFVDNPPRSRRRHGEPQRVSIGDFFGFSSLVADAQHNRVGSLNVTCTFTTSGSPSTARAVCVGAFLLKAGSITLVAALRGEPSTINAAVTGGTGAYANARGTLRAVNHKNGSSTDTITLQP